MNYAELFALRTGGPIISRLVIAVERAAIAILNEDAQTSGHAARAAWAGRAMVTDSKSQQYASIVLKIAIANDINSTINWDAIADADLQALVDTHLPRLVSAGI